MLFYSDMSKLLLSSFLRNVCQGSPTRHITSLPITPTRNIPRVSSRCSSHPAGCSLTISRPCSHPSSVGTRPVTTAPLSTDNSCQGEDAFSLVEGSLGNIMEEIHLRLQSELVLDGEMGELARFTSRVSYAVNSLLVAQVLF